MQKQNINDLKERKHIEFSKLLMIFACMVIATALAVAILNWHKTGEGLDYILSLARWMGAPVVAYMAKSGYENRAKVEQSHLDKLNKESRGV